MVECALTGADDETIEYDRGGSVSLRCLRKAIQANQVVFPAPVPIFACQHRSDIQWRLVELYFVHGWSCTRLGQRYSVTDRRIQQLIRRWVGRARALGYLQDIPAGEPELNTPEDNGRRDPTRYTPDIPPMIPLKVALIASARAEGVD